MHELGYSSREIQRMLAAVGIVVCQTTVLGEIRRFKASLVDANQADENQQAAGPVAVGHTNSVEHSAPDEFEPGRHEGQVTTGVAPTADGAEPAPPANAALAAFGKKKRTSQAVAEQYMRTFVHNPLMKD